MAVKPIYLPLVLRRSTRKQRSRAHKQKLGKSIDLRDKRVQDRIEFGHWESDTVHGIKDKTDEVIISLLEHKSRLYLALRCPSSKAADVKATLSSWLSTLSNHVSLHSVCKTITADNGREFADISQLENEHLEIFFAHPYSA